MSDDRRSDEQVLDYRNPRTARVRLRWRPFLVIGIAIAALHLWGSHVILFDMRKYRTTAYWEWTGPDGPSETMVVEVFDFPMVLFGEYQVMINDYEMRFLLLATINALIWGGSIAVLIMAMFHVLAPRNSK